MKSIKKIILSLCFLFVVQSVFPQQITLPYFNSFEDPTENATWVMNAGRKGASCIDKWYIGDIESIAILDGDSALYISSNNGDSAVLGTKNNVVVVYKKISLPANITQRKRLDLTFDWKTLVPKNLSPSLGSGLRVALVPDNFPNPVESKDNSGLEPTEWLTSTKLTMTLHDGTRTSILRNNGAWKTAHTQLVMTPGQVYKLVFVWINEGKHTKNDRKLAACIDNIQITSSDCPMPTALVVNDGCDSTVISWPGSMGASYDFEYRHSGSDQWIVVSGITRDRYAISYLKEGIYDFRVKSVCGTEVSAYRSVYSALVFCPDNHCINYIDLNSEDITCYIGNAVVGGDGSFAPCDPVDYGSQAATSRHTIHWDPNETDSRTGGRLKTVPIGEFASIRIGDFLNGGNAERIEIDYFVDTKESSILLLNYAIVFEEPNHNQEEQPYFRIRLMTPDGYEVDPTCGKSEFYANPNSPEWNRVNGVAWKNWSYIGFDLTMFDGQTLVIELDVRDCTQKGHYSYAYFALGCAKGELQGVSCGAVDTMVLEAPLGFDYQWYLDSDPSNILSTEGSFVARSADDTYVCRCISKVMGPGACDFVMKTKISPKVPHANILHNHKPVDCKNIVQLVNSSHIDTKVNGNMVCTKDKITDVFWIIDGGNNMYGDTVYHTMPVEGGIFNAKLVAKVEGGCLDTMDINVNVPSILSDTDTIRQAICWGESIDFEKRYPGGGIFGKDTTAVAYLKNSYGCDSVRVLILDVKDRLLPTERFDTICAGDIISHDGKDYTESGSYRFRYKTIDGCDSSFILHIETLPEITFTLTAKDEKDAPNTGEIIINNAPLKYTYKVNGVLNAPLTGLNGGTYEVILIDGNNCESEPQTVTIESECIEILLGEIPVLCADDESLIIPISVEQGFLTEYSVIFDTRALATGFVNIKDAIFEDGVVIELPENCRPNVYSAEIIIKDNICEDNVVPFEFTVLYSKLIMYQKWQDVIALMSKDFNGGYEFSAYKWYRNGELLENVGPILYLNGSNFELNDMYHVELTRVDDNVTMASCSMSPINKGEDLTNYPTRTLVQTSQTFILNGVHGEGTATWFDVSGRVCSRTTISDSNEIVAPSVDGFYLLEVVINNTRNIYKIYVR